MQPIDTTDARLLDLLQAGFPLTERPFDEIASRLSIAPAEAIERIARLKSGGVIREISAIFDSVALGYQSALVALKVNHDQLGAVAESVAAHPGVSHCYSRDAAYNLWFTITLPPDVELDATLERLTGRPDVEARLVLPALRVFKIGVLLSMSNEPIEPTRAPPPVRGPISLSEEERAAVRALQHDLPLVDRPFADLAARSGMTETRLLDLARSLLEQGAMRRYAAVLRHTRAGYRANAMVCWRAPPERVGDVGAKLAEHPAVSHCYERPAFPEWPYSVYTMAHARDDAELSRIVEELARSAGVSDYLVLRTLKEYRKSRVRYTQ